MKKYRDLKKDRELKKDLKNERKFFGITLTEDDLRYIFSRRNDDEKIGWELPIRTNLLKCFMV